MKARVGNSLERIVSFGALSCSVAVLICLALVFVGCTSPSSFTDLYLMKVNLSDFPEIDGFNFRRGISIGGVDTSSITDGASNVASNVANDAGSAVTSVSGAAETAVAQVSSRVENLANELKSELPTYYSIGLLGYCKGEDNNNVSCSDPSVSFSFNLSGIFNSVSSEIGDLISGVDKTVLTGYRNASHAIIWLYIFALVTGILATILGIRKAVFQGGNKLLVLSCAISFLLITAASIGVTVIYSLFTAGIKSILGPVGANASLGTHTLASTWVAVAFSFATFLIWFIQAFCCCIWKITGVRCS